MKNYLFDESKFVIKNYDKQKTFASFLPGVAGKMGIPLWAYYVNRGQGICSFGVRDKASPILEFSTGSIAYQKVSLDGFRTFLKVNGTYVEAFAVSTNPKVEREMKIDESSLTIVETNTEFNFEITVKYFGMPSENYASLVRNVELKSLDGSNLEVEILDGLTSIIPTGVSNGAYKEVANLMRSWMDVYNLENNVPLFKLRASSEDTAEVNEANNEGHFFYSLVDGKEARMIVDRNIVFGFDESMQKAEGFIARDTKAMNKEVFVTANKVPCAFTYGKAKVGKKSLVINSLIGHIEDIATINKRKKDFTQSYFLAKEKEAYDLVRELTNDISTKTAYPIFDEYSRQSYLDNFLRGGYPTLIDDGKDGVVYYLYSRKHGDLERDYNWFSLAPEYYSQGNGNYRDANQNRRSDSLFKRYVKDSNIKNFMDLIQIDGYNPLSVNGLSFTVEASDVDAIVAKVSNANDEGLKNILKGKFTPGAIINYLAKSGKSNDAAEAALPVVLNKATKHYEANFGEGYWVDHWTYNFDLVENFLAVYPDELNKMLFEDNTYKYFQSPVTVLPRSEKYVLNSKGQVRQYGAINHHDFSKCGKIGADLNSTNWLKDTNKNVYNTNLFEKLLSLAAVKFSTMDFEGMGVEMEGEKPGWNDAMNGLPGIMGSGISETVELARVVNFLVNNTSTGTVEILSEVNDFVVGLAKLVTDFNNNTIDQHTYWDLSTTLREEYRVTTDLFVSGKKVSVKLEDLNSMLTLIKGKVDSGIAKALELGKGILPTYLTYEADDFEVLKDEAGNTIPAHYNNLPKVKVKSFKLRAIPAFLEAPARSYKILSKDDVAKMHKLVKKTDLFDKKLNVYRTSVDLDPETMEVGRLRAFTKGWLERESCFLHMTYKYILGLLKAGLYTEFYQEFRNNCVAFMDPEVYGRSTLENSSFIATSCNPDPATHGRGFVSRLTGANTEYLSMWYIMMFGKKVFNMENSELTATFKPVLTADFFDENNEVSATFLGDVKVTYFNPNKKDTFATEVEFIEFNLSGEDIKVEGSKLVGDYASKLRDGSIKSIKITLK